MLELRVKEILLLSLTNHLLQKIQVFTRFAFAHRVILVRQAVASCA